MAQVSSPALKRQLEPLEETESEGTGNGWDTSDETEDVAQRNELRGFFDLPIEVGVQLGHRLITFREVVELQVGSVIRMERSAGENVDLLMAGRPVGRGEIVVIEDMMGLRITDLAYPDTEPATKAVEE